MKTGAEKVNVGIETGKAAGVETGKAAGDETGKTAGVETANAAGVETGNAPRRVGVSPGREFPSLVVGEALVDSVEFCTVDVVGEFLQRTECV